jgi:hypothetical protein
MGIVDWLEAGYKSREEGVTDVSNEVLDELLFKLELVLSGYWGGREFGGE